MKKLIHCAAAIAMAFFAGSCQQEMLEPAAQETTVTYSVELPKLQTKAIGDGFNVNQLVYEVWKTENPNERDLKNPDAKATRLYQATAEMAKIDGEQKTIVSLNLVHDQNYTILFWAQYADNEVSPYYVTEDLTAVTYKKEVGKGGYLSNDENMAAFYITEFLTAEEIEKPGIKRIELKRPFAQLNIGTKNTAEEYEITMTESKVTIANVPTVFDVAQNTPANPAVTGEKTFVFNYAGLPTNPETLTVNDIPYHYVAMNYIFATNNVTVTYEIDADLKAYDTGAVTEATVTNIVYEVPLKENYRTNIVGNLITSTTEYEVVIDASWDDVNAENWDGNVEEVWDEKYIQEPKMVNGVYEISLASELAWLAAKVNGIPYVDSETNSVKYNKPEKFSGKTFRLVEDIDLVGEDRDNLTWTPIGVSSEFEGVFDGNGHKISNLVVKAEGTTPAGLFGKIKKATVKDVTVENANVQGHGSAAVVVAHAVCGKIENCHVNGATVVSTPIEKDHANNVGGIVGYLDGDSVGYVKNSSVNNATITAYRKVGGIVGAANQKAEVTGNTVSNTTITADQRVEYGEVKAAEAGKIAGYKHKNATITDTNKAVDTEVIVYIDDAAEMSGAAGDDVTFIYLQGNTYDVTEKVEVDGSLQIATGNDVVINGNGNNIYAGTPDHYSFITEGNEASLVLNGVNVIANGGAIAASNAGNVTINGGSVALNATTTNPRYSIYAVGNDTEVTINGGEFSISKLTLKRAYIYASAGATVYVKGGKFGKASTRDGYKAGIRGDGNVIITGGTFGFDPTNWVAAGYAALKDGQEWVVKSLSEPATLAAAVAVPGATVNVAAGNYTFPSSSIAEGVTINCAEGTVFTGNSKLNIKGATVVGAKFSNPSGTAVDQTINGTFKNCVFEGANALRWCYAGETVVFENCVFSGSTYGVHFDGGANKAYFKTCTFSGFNAFPADMELVTFEECIFEGNGKSGYNGANLWGSAKFIKTTFKFDGTTANEWIDMIGVDKTYEMKDCTLNEGGSVFNPEFIFSRNKDTKATIDGVLYTWTGKYFADKKNNKVVVAEGETLKEALNNGENVTLLGNVNTTDTGSNGYGSTGISVNGTVLDGAGNTLEVEGATGTWDSAVSTYGGTIKNITIAKGFRGIFVTANENASKVILENVTIEGPTYTISCDSASKQGLEATGCVIKGWTSYAGTIGDVKFTNCNFGKGAGYQFCRPYAPTEFIGCSFDAGYQIDARAAVTFENCTVGGVALTAENLSTLVTSNIANATVK